MGPLAMPSMGKTQFERFLTPGLANMMVTLPPAYDVGDLPGPLQVNGNVFMTPFAARALGVGMPVPHTAGRVTSSMAPMQHASDEVSQQPKDLRKVQIDVARTYEDPAYRDQVRLLLGLQEKFPLSEFRIATKGRGSGKVQRLVGSQWKMMCKHMKRRSRCKECGGSEICKHQRRRSQAGRCGVLPRARRLAHGCC